MEIIQKTILITTSGVIRVLSRGEIKPEVEKERKAGLPLFSLNGDVDNLNYDSILL